MYFRNYSLSAEFRPSNMSKYESQDTILLLTLLFLVRKKSFLLVLGIGLLSRQQSATEASDSIKDTPR